MDADTPELEKLSIDEIPADLVFNTKTWEEKGESPDEEVFSAVIDGSKLSFYRPTPEALTRYAAASSRLASLPDKMATILAFAQETFTEESYMVLDARLRNRADSFGVLELFELVGMIVDKFADRNRAERRAAERGAR